jgi:hypothetical protein
MDELRMQYLLALRSPCSPDTLGPTGTGALPAGQRCVRPRALICRFDLACRNVRDTRMRRAP